MASLETLLTTFFIWLGLASALDIPADHPLNDALHHFEVLHVSHLSHHAPPHTSLPHNRDTTHIHFRTLDRDFNLILTPSLSTVHHSLHVTVVTEAGEDRRQFPFPHLYSGHLLGVAGSHVTAQLHPLSGVLLASIHTQEEVYYVEPLSRLLPAGSHDRHMITYQHSHVKFNLTSQHFCGNHDHHKFLGKQASPWKRPPYQSSEGYHEKQRLKRGLAGDVCTLHLVATPTFHSQTSTDPDTTALFLLGLISDIDKNIFQVPKFSTSPSRLGLVVTNITIHASESASSPPYARNGERNSETLLKLFSEYDWSNVCLAHLFTAVSFADDRLGVAYVASRDLDDIGGICSPLVSGSNGRMGTANVGVSSFRNSVNRPLLFAEARLVTAHEIGHGWGSEHDPTGDPICSPPVSRNQGKFLMFPSATDGDQKNNDVLSLCSVAMISDVVEQKGSCFKDRSQLEGLCGNYMVEEGEECDAGALGMVNSDPCCTSDCRLRPTTAEGEKVECSDANDDCCQDCRVSSAESMKLCQNNREGNSNCLRSVFCMGDKVCPQTLTFELQYVEENSTCGQLGRCLPPDSVCGIDGNCMTGSDPERLLCFSFCQWHGLEECFCTGSDECRFCCLQTVRGTRNRTCMPFSDVSRPDRSSCIGGFCDHGVCVPASLDLIQRLFVLFDNPSLNTFVQFMRENIVGTILLLTVFIWVPGSFFINVFDVYRWRKHKRVAREFEADLQDAEQEDEDDLFLYDNVFEEMEQTQPGLLRPEAKIALMRLDSGTFDDYFGSDDMTAPLTPHVPVTSSAPYSGLWEHRLSTITEESTSVPNPERDNIHLFGFSRTPKRSSGGEGGGFLEQSSFDAEHGTLV